MKAMLSETTIFLMFFSFFELLPFYPQISDEEWETLK